jgi:Uma2 family endonuclease
MDPAPTDLLSRYPASRHRLTRQDFYRLGDAGILKHDDRVELLEGQLIDMPPISPRCANAVSRLNELLVLAFVGRAVVRCRSPIVLDDSSEPLPDFALLRRHWRESSHDHPTVGDVFLVVEIADSSLNFDRAVKLPLYARAGIPEVWIVDLTTDTVHVHRNPSGLGYGSVTQVGSPGQLDVEALAGVTIQVSAIFA